MNIPFPNGLKKSDGTWDICPVHSYFGFKMRWEPRQAHHLYWGILVLIVSWYGSISALVLGGLLGTILFVLGLSGMLLGYYIARDDVLQHHEQVKNIKYHSPVHVWYGEHLYKYRVVRYVNRLADNIMSKLRSIL
jgi:hypothetical protein